MHKEVFLLIRFAEITGKFPIFLKKSASKFPEFPGKFRKIFPGKREEKIWDFSGISRAGIPGTPSLVSTLLILYFLNGNEDTFLRR